MRCYIVQLLAKFAHHKCLISDASTQEGFNFGEVSGIIRGGADMMDGASSFIKKLTSTFGSK